VQESKRAREANANAAEAKTNASVAKTNADRADREAELARQAKLTSDRRLYVANMNLAQPAAEDLQFSPLHELLHGQVPAGTDAPDLRAFEWHYWRRYAHGEQFTIKGFTQTVTCVAFSPDERTLATGGQRFGRKGSIIGEVMLWDAADGRLIRTFPGHAGGVA